MCLPSGRTTSVEGIQDVHVTPRMLHDCHNCD